MKNLFSLDKEITYLNCAYMSPLLKTVEAAGIQGVSRKASPYGISGRDFFDPPARVRQKFAKLINAKDPNRIALIPSVSYGMANVARNIPLEKGEEILVLEEQFPSNIYTWKKREAATGAKIRFVKTPAVKTGRGQQWNENILAAINDKTRVVAIGSVHWADGTSYDLEAIRAKATKHNALLVIDGTQSVGALPIDVQRVKPDALICASYKWLMGPYSSGFAYLGAYFDQGTPIEDSWINRLDSDNFKELVNYQEQYTEKAGRYMMGEYSNFIAIPMLEAALDQLLAWHPAAIQDHCEAIVAPFLAAFENLGCYIESPDFRGHHLFGIHLPKWMNLDKLAASIQENKISVSLRGEAVRISPHLYNTEEDVAKLLSCFPSR